MDVSRHSHGSLIFLAFGTRRLVEQGHGSLIFLVWATQESRICDFERDCAGRLRSLFGPFGCQIETPGANMGPEGIEGELPGDQEGGKGRLWAALGAPREARRGQRGPKWDPAGAKAGAKVTPRGGQEGGFWGAEGFLGAFLGGVNRTW